MAVKRVVPSIQWHPALPDLATWAFQMELEGADELHLRIHQPSLALADLQMLVKRMLHGMGIPLVLQYSAGGEEVLSRLLEQGVDRLLLDVGQFAALPNLVRRFGRSRFSAWLPSASVGSEELWPLFEKDLGEVLLDGAGIQELLAEGADTWGGWNQFPLPVSVWVAHPDPALCADLLQSGASAVFVAGMSDEPALGLPKLRAALAMEGVAIRT